jgi:hypothetical protein
VAGNYKTFRAPIKTYAKLRKSPQRIRIAQPVQRPLTLRGGIVHKAAMRPDATWFILHHRYTVTKPGVDPMEARAVPHWQVKGTLPERIVYKALVDNFHMVSGVDFDFQSSTSGGRQELGGIVADFLFFYKKLILQVQGPTHTDFLRQAKDEEQRMILGEMGYTVEYLNLEVIQNELWLEDTLRRMFGLRLGNGAGSGTMTSPWSEADTHYSDALPAEDLQAIYSLALQVEDNLHWIKEGKL